MGTHIPSQKSRRVRQETVSKLKQMSMQMNKTMKLIDYTDGPALHYYSDGSRAGASGRCFDRSRRARCDEPWILLRLVVACVVSPRPPYLSDHTRGAPQQCGFSSCSRSRAAPPSC